MTDAHREQETPATPCPGIQEGHYYVHCRDCGHSPVATPCQAVKERDEARRECDQWREKWNATLDREARRNAEILQLKAANNEMREVLLTLSTADPKLLAEQPEMTAGIARMALQLANHWAAKGSVDAA